MGLIKTLGRYAWRKFALDGVSSSGFHEPEHRDIFAFVDKVDEVTAALSAAGSLKGEWDASSGLFPGAGVTAMGDTWLVTEAGTTGGRFFAEGDRIVALVVNASTSVFTANWGVIPANARTVVVGVDAGTGTANAIQVTTEDAVANGTVVIFSLFRDTTGSPVKVSINGGPLLTAVTNRGNNASGLTADMEIWGRYRAADNTFRLLNDQDVSALVAQAEAARDAAIAAAATATAAANGNLAFPTKAAAISASVDAAIHSITLKGGASDGDGLGGLYIDTDNGAVDAFTSNGGTRAWYRVIDGAFVAALKRRNEIALGKVNNKIMSGDALAVACVGDSLTYGMDTVSGDVIAGANGSGVTRAPVQYPARLKTRLEELTASTVTIVNRGFPGDTAKDVLERWPTNPGGDLAIIMVGTNDADGNHDATFDEYVTYTERLIQLHILWGLAVLVITPTARQFNNSDAGPGRYGQFLRQMAAVYGCPVMTGEEVHQYCLASEVYSDSTHFNQYGYAKLGDAVAAFLMSGSLVRPIRGVSSEVFINPVRGSEGVGFHRKGTAAASTNTASYSSSNALLQLGADGVASLSFYLDAEAADVYVVGQIHDCEVSCSAVSGAQNRMPLKNNNQRNIRETGTYTVGTDHSNQYGVKALAGSLVGRGWKTLVIKGTASGTRLFNELVIAPKKMLDVSQHGDKFRPAAAENMVYMVPNYSQTSGALPAKAVLTGDIALPMPAAIRGGGTHQNHFGFGGVVEVTIKTMASADSGVMPNGITKLLLYRNAQAQSLAMDVVYKTDAACIEPTAVGIASTSYDSSLSGPASLGKSDHPDGAQQGWIYLTFAGTVEAFFVIEFHSLARGDAEGSWMN